MIQYFSASYFGGLAVMIVGIVMPLTYMVLQNKKSFRAFRKEG